MEGKDKYKNVDYDVLEGRKPPSKEELEEGKLEHLFIVDHDAWERKMKEKKPQLPPNRVIREDGKPLSQNDQDEIEALFGKKPPIDTKDKSLSQCSIDLNTLSGLSGGGPGNTRFLEEYKENQEAAEQIVKEYQTSQQQLDPDIEIRQLKKKVASLELQVKDIWVHMRSMERNKNDR
jgi:hypothetical protein